MTTSDGTQAAARLLDPRFKYTPAVATNIAATWKRFGFDPRANEQRRTRATSAFTASANEMFAGRGLIVVKS
jgi:hypothetical protein